MWFQHSEVQLCSNLSSQWPFNSRSRSLKFKWCKSCKSWKHYESHVKQKKSLQSKIKGVWTLRPEQVGGLPDACGILRNSESGVDIWSMWRSKCKMPWLDKSWQFLCHGECQTLREDWSESTSQKSCKQSARPQERRHTRHIAYNNSR